MRSCAECGKGIEGREEIVVFRGDQIVRFHRDCYRRSLAPAEKAPAYNQRPLGFPSARGGRVSPGRYEWHD